LFLNVLKIFAPQPTLLDNVADNFQIYCFTAGRGLQRNVFIKKTYEVACKLAPAKKA